MSLSPRPVLAGERVWLRDPEQACVLSEPCPAPDVRGPLCPPRRLCGAGATQGTPDHVTQGKLEASRKLTPLPPSRDPSTAASPPAPEVGARWVSDEGAEAGRASRGGAGCGVGAPVPARGVGGGAGGGALPRGAGVWKLPPAQQPSAPPPASAARLSKSTKPVPATAPLGRRAGQSPRGGVRTDRGQALGPWRGMTGPASSASAGGTTVEDPHPGEAAPPTLLHGSPVGVKGWAGRVAAGIQGKAHPGWEHAGPAPPPQAAPR